jgi:hypothetical protein
MSTKMDRVILYVKHLNDEPSKEEVKDLLEDMRYLDFVNVMDIKRTDIGEWDDDHKLNYLDATMKDYDKYFPELDSKVNEKDEIAKERDLRMKAEKSFQKKEREVVELKKKLEKFEKLNSVLKDHYK